MAEPCGGGPHGTRKGIPRAFGAVRRLPPEGCAAGPQLPKRNVTPAVARQKSKSLSARSNSSSGSLSVSERK